MEGGGERWPDLKQGAEGGPECGGKLGASVQDDCFMQAVGFPDMVKVEACDFGCIGGLVAWD